MKEKRDHGSKRMPLSVVLIGGAFTYTHARAHAHIYTPIPSPTMMMLVISVEITIIVKTRKLTYSKIKIPVEYMKWNFPISDLKNWKIKYTGNTCIYTLTRFIL